MGYVVQSVYLRTLRASANNELIHPGNITNSGLLSVIEYSAITAKCLVKKRVISTGPFQQHILATEYLWQK